MAKKANLCVDLSSIVKKYTNKQTNQKARQKFLHYFNASLAKSMKNPKNISFGEFNSETHQYEFQVILHDYLAQLKHYAMLSNFSSSSYINELSQFLNRAFVRNKLYITFRRSEIGNVRIGHKVAFHLDDPRRYSPDNQTGLNLWLQFQVIPNKR